MKTCSICKREFDRGGGAGPKDEVLCPAHYSRFVRGSKTWNDPNVRGEGADLERIRIAANTKHRLMKAFALELKKRPTLAFYAFVDELIP